MSLPHKSVWQSFLETPHLADYLSLMGLLLTLVGFSATIVTALRAKKAADAARDAAQAATNEVKKVDLVAEIATVVQLIEELKRLQRARAIDVLHDRYSGLRAKIISMRESKFLDGENEQALLQDVVARIAALEKSLDRNSSTLNDSRNLARSNESLSICTESILMLNERVKSLGWVDS